MTRRLATAALALALAACARTVVRAPTDAAEDSVQNERCSRPEDIASLLEIDPSRSLVVAHVGHGGTLPALGHDHVVASHDVRGFVDPSSGQAVVTVSLAGLVVDEPALRAAGGLTTQPSDEDIAGTRRNMLKSLHADEHPNVRVEVRVASPSVSALSAAVTLNGRTMQVPASIAIDRTPTTIHAGGRMMVRQTEFGLVPFSILAGAVEVSDEIEIAFDVFASACR